MLGLLQPIAAAADDAPPTLAGFADVVPDPAGDQLYVSQGDDLPVVVANAEGQPISTLDTASAGAMTWHSQSQRLVVAASGGASLSLLDPRGERAAVNLDWSEAAGTAFCVEDISADATHAWFSYDDCNAGPSQLGAVDLASGSPSLGLKQLFHDGQVESISGAGELLVWSQHESGTSVSRSKPTPGVAPDTVDVTDVEVVDTTQRSLVMAVDEPRQRVVTNTSEVPLNNLSALQELPLTLTGQDIDINPDGVVGAILEDVRLNFSESNRFLDRFWDDSRRALGGAFLGSRYLAVVKRDSEAPQLRVFQPRFDSEVEVKLGRDPGFGGSPLLLVTVARPDIATHRVQVYATDHRGRRLVFDQELPSLNDTRRQQRLRMPPLQSLTTYQVAYVGGTYASSDQASVKTDKPSSLVTARMRGFAKRDGVTYVYSSKSATIDVKVEPGLAARCVRLSFNIKIDGRFRAAGQSKCGFTNDRGRVRFVIGSSPKIRGKLINMNVRAREDSWNHSTSAQGGFQFVFK